MSSTESFDELEKQLAERIEEALNEIRGEFQDRIQSAGERLEELVSTEMATARSAAAEAAGAEAEQTRAAFEAEAEELKAAAIAEAIAAKETEFQELLHSKDSTLAELEQARDAALAEAQAARDEAQAAREAALAESEEATETAIASAIEAKEAELNEILASKDRVIAELEESKERELNELRDEMESALSAARSAAEETLTGAVSAAIQSLHEMVAQLDRGQSQTDILEALLSSSGQYSSRSILFLTTERGLEGWGGQGFDTEEGRLQELLLDYEEGTVWAELVEGHGTVQMSSESCAQLCRQMDGSEPREGALIPLVLRDRLAAALYADRLDEDSNFQLSVLQLLSYIAGQALETLPMRRREATATLRLVQDAPADDPGLELWQFLVPEEPLVEQPVSVPAEPLEEELTAEAAFEAEVEDAEPTPVEPPPPSDYMPAEETGFTVEDAAGGEEPAPEPEAAVEAAPPAEVETPSEAESPTEVVPPTEVAPPVAAGAEVAPPEDVDGPGWAFTTRRFGEGTEEDAGHEEARRLARLLVTEIKLYNEEQVEEGRRGRNIYRTLREDIDRSRQIYEERIEETVRSDTDYFREELVRILAGGDEEIMGV